jgi:hypothetical protein
MCSIMPLCDELDGDHLLWLRDDIERRLNGS